MSESVAINAPAPIATPIAAAHILITEPGPGPDDSWEPIPPSWSKIRFSVVDVLYIAPFIGRLPERTFVVDEPAMRGQHKGSLVKRLEWVIRRLASRTRKSRSWLSSFGMKTLIGT